MKLALYYAPIACSLVWIWRRAGQFKLDLSAFPSYAAHGERMMKRESVKRALAFERELQAQAEKAA